jgi:Polyketide cyclase / dehydrase and lipid transport
VARHLHFETTASQEVRARADAVMATIRDARTWPRWQPEIETTEGSATLEAGDAVTGKASMMGFAVDGRSTIESVEATSLAEDTIVGVRMRIRFEVNEAHGRTVITHHLTSEMPAGALGSVLTFFLRKRLIKMQKTALQQLAQVVDASP